MSSDAPDRGAGRRLGVGAAVVLLLAALCVTVGIGIVRTATAPVETVTVDGGGDAAATAGPTGTAGPVAPELYVHVSGRVAAPGLYVLSAGARVVDAVAAAGGFTPDADEASVNLAREVADGEQVVVRAVGEAVPDAAGAASGQGAAASGVLDLNTADVAALDTLPRIGPALAARIIAWREDNGPFTSVEDLLGVPGIGEKMLASLRDLVRV